MSTTLIYGLLLAVLILGPLIILHEFGHFFLAKFHKVKVLEFGFGFPPRAFGIWSGATKISTSSDTRFEFDDERDGLRVGQMVTVIGREWEDGAKEAAIVRPFDRKDASVAQTSASIFVGKLRRIDANSIDIADMVWSINWLPVGGFVKLRGEENPEARDSLAGKSALARISVIVAGVVQ